MKNQWNMLFLAKEAYSQCIHDVCVQYELNHMELSVLLLLAGDSSLDTAQKIVNAYHLSKSHVSTSLNTLENKGFVKRLGDGRKRKNICLRVMESGFEVAEAGKKALGELQTIIEQGFSEQERVFLNNSMEKVNLNLQKYIHDRQEGHN